MLNSQFLKHTAYYFEIRLQFSYNKVCRFKSHLPQLGNKSQYLSFDVTMHVPVCLKTNIKHPNKMIAMESKLDWSSVTEKNGETVPVSR